MKKIVLLLLVLMSVTTMYAQQNETKGDQSMAAGDYARAVEYYTAAVNQNPTDALVEKLSRATMLKSEFESIDAAIAEMNAEQLELHISNVLAIDPNNKFVEMKRRQLSVYHQNTKKRKVKDFFIGNEKRVEIFGWYTFDQGIGLASFSKANTSFATLSQRFRMRYLRSFPFELDFETQLGVHEQTRKAIWSVGAGSCFFVGDHLTIDYGLGYQVNKMSYRGTPKDKGMYYRAGLTYMGNSGFGASYSFSRNTNKNEPAFNLHQVSLHISFVDNPTAKWGTFLLLLWHGTAAAIVFSYMGQ